MDQNILVAILIIVAGLLGGITNHFRIDQEEKTWFSFFKNVLMGLSASFLIPLFLNMISSNLLKESSSDSSRYFIFFGFCLIASLSSKAFIQTISDRLLNEVKKTKKEVESVKEDVEPIISRETEVQEGEVQDYSSKARFIGLDEDTKKVLVTLDSGRYAWRSLTGIAKDTKFTIEKVLKSLDWLLSHGLVVKKSEKGRWGLTLEGRNVFMALHSMERSKQKKKE